ncbi:MAG TPA: adenylate/guanylate cyclase domain-containing protein [Gaiellaceae bacterium]|nr:adenylate/guanylate cyclase domain-containing protein [Gaiellaceae bacterium]
MERPETHFAWSGDAALAYQVLGEGAETLMYLQGWASNVELNWDEPRMARFLRRLAEHRRLVVADGRGMGCSERSTSENVWPLEMLAHDVGVVLDAVGVERAAILATDHMGFVGCMFAAAHPERVHALLLYEASANYAWSEETPWEFTFEEFEQQIEEKLQNLWSPARAWAEVAEFAPSVAGDPGYVQWWYRYILLSEAFGSATATIRKYMHTDIRPILPTIHVPALVLLRPGARGGDPAWHDASRYVARCIPGARVHELAGIDVPLWVGDLPEVVTAIEAFLADVRQETSELERVLATVLFTDIVSSTAKLAEIGDAGWRDLVERHHAHVRALLERFRGREIDTAGDGFFASFDGPARAIRCAQAIVAEVEALGIEVRAGVHTGECEVIDGKVGGIAVNIGARVGAAAQPSEVLVSQTVKDLVAGSGLAFEDRGEHALKGIEGTWRLYRVVS